MATFERTLTLARPVADVFAFFLVPRQTLPLAPPELHLQLVEGPERLQLGSRLVRTGRRWGLPQRVASEVTALEAEVLLVEAQVQGPFRRWVHALHFQVGEAGNCVLRECIEFEPPGGMLGLLVTEQFLRKDLEWLFDFRHRKLQALWNG
jgi:ligand-binding SRPBCC domain-containing protein